MDHSYELDPRYKKFSLAVEKNLQIFESIEEWADIISFLTKFGKTLKSHPHFNSIPYSVLVSKRMAQCLNPALPAGVHQKALETYAIIFEKLGAENLGNEFYTYSYGILQFFRHCSLSVKKLYLSVFEKYLLPLASSNQESVASLIQSLAPGLEEEANEFYDNVKEILLSIFQAVGESVFYRIFWESMLNIPHLRLSIIHFFQSNLPSRSYLDSMTVACQKIMIHALGLSLVDTVPLVIRGTLEIILKLIPINSVFLAYDNKIYLMQQMLRVLLKRDISLSRRSISWILGQEASFATTSSISAIGSPSFPPVSIEVLVDSIKSMLHVHPGMSNEDLTILTHPFRILVVLLDKPEIGGLLSKHVILDVVNCVFEAYRLFPDSYFILEAANMFFEVADLQIVWSALYSHLSTASDLRAAFDLVNFAMRNLSICDNEAIHEHIPLILFSTVHRVTKLFDNHENEKCILLMLDCCHYITSLIPPNYVVYNQACKDLSNSEIILYISKFFDMPLDTFILSPQQKLGNSSPNLSPVSSTSQTNLHLVPKYPIAGSSISAANILVGILNEILDSLKKFSDVWSIVPLEKLLYILQWTCSLYSLPIESREEELIKSICLVLLEISNMASNHFVVCLEFLIHLANISSYKYLVSYILELHVTSLFGSLWNIYKHKDALMRNRVVLLFWSLHVVCRSQHLDKFFVTQLSFSPGIEKDNLSELSSVLFFLRDCDAYLDISQNFLFTESLFLLLKIADDMSNVASRRLVLDWLGDHVLSNLSHLPRVLDPLLGLLIDPSILIHERSTKEHFGLSISVPYYELPFNIERVFTTLLLVKQIGSFNGGKMINLLFNDSTDVLLRRPGGSLLSDDILMSPSYAAALFHLLVDFFLCEADTSLQCDPMLFSTSWFASELFLVESVQQISVELSLELLQRALAISCTSFITNVDRFATLLLCKLYRSQLSSSIIPPLLEMLLMLQKQNRHLPTFCRLWSSMEGTQLPGSQFLAPFQQLLLEGLTLESGRQVLVWFAFLQGFFSYYPEFVLPIAEAIHLRLVDSVTPLPLMNTLSSLLNWILGQYPAMSVASSLASLLVVSSSVISTESVPRDPSSSANGTSATPGSLRIFSGFFQQAAGLLLSQQHQPVNTTSVLPEPGVAVPLLAESRLLNLLRFLASKAIGIQLVSHLIISSGSSSSQKMETDGLQWLQSLLLKLYISCRPMYFWLIVVLWSDTIEQVEKLPPHWIPHSTLDTIHRTYSETYLAPLVRMIVDAIIDHSEWLPALIDIHRSLNVEPQMPYPEFAANSPLVNVEANRILILCESILDEVYSRGTSDGGLFTRCLMEWASAMARFTRDRLAQPSILVCLVRVWRRLILGRTASKSNYSFWHLLSVTISDEQSQQPLKRLVLAKETQEIFSKLIHEGILAFIQKEVVLRTILYPSTAPPTLSDNAGVIAQEFLSCLLDLVLHDLDVLYGRNFNFELDNAKPLPSLLQTGMSSKRTSLVVDGAMPSATSGGLSHLSSAPNLTEDQLAALDKDRITLLQTMSSNIITPFIRSLANWTLSRRGGLSSHQFRQIFSLLCRVVIQFVQGISSGSMLSLSPNNSASLQSLCKFIKQLFFEQYFLICNDFFRFDACELENAALPGSVNVELVHLLSELKRKIVSFSTGLLANLSSGLDRDRWNDLLLRLSDMPLNMSGNEDPAELYLATLPLRRLTYVLFLSSPFDSMRSMLPGLLEKLVELVAARGKRKEKRPGGDLNSGTALSSLAGTPLSFEKNLGSLKSASIVSTSSTSTTSSSVDTLFSPAFLLLVMTLYMRFPSNQISTTLIPIILSESLLWIGDWPVPPIAFERESARDMFLDGMPDPGIFVPPPPSVMLASLTGFFRLLEFLCRTGEESWGWIRWGLLYIEDSNQSLNDLKLQAPALDESDESCFKKSTAAWHYFLLSNCGGKLACILRWLVLWDFQSRMSNSVTGSNGSLRRSVSANAGASELVDARRTGDERDRRRGLIKRLRDRRKEKKLLEKQLRYDTTTVGMDKEVLVSIHSNHQMSPVVDDGPVDSLDISKLDFSNSRSSSLLMRTSSKSLNSEIESDDFPAGLPDSASNEPYISQKDSSLDLFSIRSAHGFTASPPSFDVDTVVNIDFNEHDGNVRDASSDTDSDVTSLSVISVPVLPSSNTKIKKSPTVPGVFLVQPDFSLPQIMAFVVEFLLGDLPILQNYNFSASSSAFSNKAIYERLLEDLILSGI